MPAKTTPKEWDEVRTAFATSIMVDTSLNSLAQNLDGPDWPVKGADETPAKYIDLSHEEVVELLALKNQPEESLDFLTSILRDTLAFDDPFGEMLEQTEEAANRDNPVLKNLAKLGIPENFPLEHCALAPDTREFCRLEKLGTLSEFAVFAQNMSQNVIVGGDFRALLNALSHVDEQTIARFLPYRPGVRGLQVIEGTAQIVRSLPPEPRRALARSGAPVPPEVATRVASLVKVLPESLASLQAQLAAGGDLSRLVQVLNDPEVEPAVAKALTPYRPKATLTEEEPREAPRKGLLGSLARWFGK